MVRRNYEALVSGDGACAGCGEKSVLRAVASVTEAYMRPMYHKKAARLREKANELESNGAANLAALKERSEEEYNFYKRSIAHVVMGLGGENDADTDHRLEAHGEIADAELIDALIAVLRQDAFNHRDIQAIDGRHANGMSVMYLSLIHISEPTRPY